MPKRLALLCALLIGGAIWSEPAGAYWELNGVRLCQGEWINFIEAVVPDSSEGAIVIWSENGGGSRARRVDFAGRLRWDSCGVVVHVGSANGLSACSDGAGGAIIAWSQLQDGGTYRLLAQRIDGNGQFVWPSGGIPVCNAPGNQWVNGAIADRHGGAIITWTDSRTDPSGDLYAQRLSESGQAQWAPEGAPICTAAGSQGGSKSVWADDGTILIAWIDGRTSESDVYAQRLSDQGVRLWGNAGKPVTRAAGDQVNASIAPDGAGGALVFWGDYSSSNTGAVSGQHVRPNGSTTWKLNGVPIAGLAGPPATVADGFGGAFVCAGRCQHIDSTTTIGPEGGFPLTTYPRSNPEGSTIVADGAGGLIAVWRDKRNLSVELFGQGFDSVGNEQWIPGGTPVCWTPGDPYGAVATSDGRGGMVVAWLDPRSHVDVGLYVERLYFNGVVDPVLSVGRHEVSGAASLLSPAPNPAMGGSKLRFSLPQAAPVRLEVFDALGRSVRTLMSSSLESSGEHAVTWDGLDATGATAKAGLYFISLRVGASVTTRKLVLCH
jgi:FlgD Ig-like domain